MTSMALVLCLYYYFWKNFTPFSSVSTAYFEQVNGCWQVNEKWVAQCAIYSPKIIWETQLRGEKDLSIKK